MSWHILKVYGQAQKIETAINDLGGEAYWPHEIVRRRNRRSGSNRGAIVEHRQAVTPGYMFINNACPIDLERVPEAILARARKANASLYDQGEDQVPRTVACHVKYLTYPNGNLPWLPDCIIADLRKAVDKRNGANGRQIIKAVADVLAGIEKVLRHSKRKRGQPVFASFGEVTKASAA